MNGRLGKRVRISQLKGKTENRKESTETTFQESLVEEENVDTKKYGVLTSRGVRDQEKLQPKENNMALIYVNVA